MGRSDDLEMVGGITVAPRDIEAVLLEHLRVAEAAVAAVPDERGATKLRAFVVPRPSPTADDDDALERALLALTSLPRTATGKLQRFIFRAGDW